MNLCIDFTLFCVFCSQFLICFCCVCYYAEFTCGERNLPRMSKIIGGSRSSVESQPWMAAIFFGKGFVCGGTLIAPCWVLTAAHCFPSGYVWLKTMTPFNLNYCDTNVHQHFIWTVGKQKYGNTLSLWEGIPSVKLTQKSRNSWWADLWSIEALTTQLKTSPMTLVCFLL